MISFATSDREDQPSKDYHFQVCTDNQASAPRHNNAKSETRDHCQSIPKYRPEDKRYEKEG
jgi:hypothetical protein